MESAMESQQAANGRSPYPPLWLQGELYHTQHNEGSFSSCSICVCCNNNLHSPTSSLILRDLEESFTFTTLTAYQYL